MLTWLL